MNLDILNAVVRDLLISEGKYHQYKNKVFKSKKDYKRKKNKIKKEIKNEIDERKNNI